MTAEEIESFVWGFLKGKSLPEKSVASVMGNIYAESGFNPNSVEVGNGIGLGLCQWSYGRRTQLEAYGIDLQHQCDFLWSELSGQNLAITGADYQWVNKSGYLNHDDFMAGNGVINDLTSAFCFCWERPNVDLAHLDVRQTWANTFYTEFTGTGGNPGGSGTVKLKSYYLYGCTDSFLGRKFVPRNKSFTLVSVRGDMAVIKDGGIIHHVPKKNLISV